MHSCQVIADKHLLFFVSENQKFSTFQFLNTTTVRDVVISLGIPPVEVSKVYINKTLSDLDSKIFNGEKIALHTDKFIYPTGFILDVHLGSLARYIRMLGFDCLYRNDFSDPEIINVAEKENRSILTRDLGILLHRRVNQGYFVRATNPKLQIIEIINKYNLKLQFAPFTRCMKCNGLLFCIDKSKIEDEVPEAVWQLQEDFYQCNNCHKIYWPGTHYQNMKKFISQLNS